MNSRAICGAATAVAVMLSFAPVATAEPVLDAQCPGPASSNRPTVFRNAQTFTAQTTGSLVQGQFQIVKFGGAGDWTMTLYTTDASGVPTNNGLASTAIADATVPIGVSNLAGVFSPPPAIVAGQTYALGIARSPDADWGMAERGGNPCPGGEYGSLTAAGAWTNNGEAFDWVFATFVEPAPPSDLNAPSVTITKKPKDTTKKKAATFEFTGTDARAVGSFQCSLDGGPFSTCTSPHTVKVKKGKHTFEVRAVDQAGNVGAAASDSWKRKRKGK